MSAAEGFVCLFLKDRRDSTQRLMRSVLERSRPMSFIWNNDPFVERLQQCAGSPWTVFEAQQQLDALVLCPLPLSPDDSSADSPSFVDFLANTFHRRLLHCFVGGNVVRAWTLEDLMRQVRPPSPQALRDALERCEFWQIALAEMGANIWRGHPRLATLNNLGWTFEWILQVLLERNYGALVRRHVVLGEIAALGEIDVLALLVDKWNRNMVPPSRTCFI
jgi:hypothetical protein